MIFITVGTQKFEFNRLLEAVDSLIESGVIAEEVFAQIGYSTYVPRHYEYVDFLSPNDFREKMETCSILITHGGVGSIHGGLESGKKTIVVPRLAKYGEHVDDHQIEIAKKYAEFGYVLTVDESSELGAQLKAADDFKSHYSKKNTENGICETIAEFIKNI